MMEHNKARRAEPHAATPPHDPANPGLEQILQILKQWQRRCAYEQTSMSEARFSGFLSELIFELEKGKPE